MRAALVLLVGGCYAATPPSGAPCDPATPNCPTGQACIAGASGFACLPEGTTPVVDAASPDSAMVLRACPADPDLLVCFSFDQPQLASPLANEGTIAAAASFTNVSRIAVPGGGAALFSSTSEMLFPPHAQLAGIVAFDATVRLDAEVPAMGRVGVLDADASSAGLSLFIFAGTTTPHRIRCNAGDADVFADTAITLGAWTTLACACENGETVVRRDGAVLAKGTGCVPGTGAANGLQIGQNSRAGAMLPPNEPFIGAIDRVRVWTRVPTP